jgi:hypothetical protein
LDHPIPQLGPIPIILILITFHTPKNPIHKFNLLPVTPNTVLLQLYHKLLITQRAFHLAQLYPTLKILVTRQVDKITTTSTIGLLFLRIFTSDGKNFWISSKNLFLQVLRPFHTRIPIMVIARSINPPDKGLFLQLLSQEFTFLVFQKYFLVFESFLMTKVDPPLDITEPVFLFA